MVTPVILATQEADIRRISVWSQSRWIVHETLPWKKPSQKRVGGVAQGEGPEFKPQYHKKVKNQPNKQTKKTPPKLLHGLPWVNRSFIDGDRPSSCCMVLWMLPSNFWMFIRNSSRISCALWYSTASVCVLGCSGSCSAISGTSADEAPRPVSALCWLKDRAGKKTCKTKFTDKSLTSFQQLTRLCHPAFSVLSGCAQGSQVIAPGPGLHSKVQASMAT
jgi:hypothetical protein